MTNTTPEGKRWMGAAAVGTVLLLVFGTGGLLRFVLFGNPDPHDVAIRDLRRIAAAVSSYQEQHGVLPRSLIEVAGDIRIPKRDPWGRPYTYARSGPAWEIRSAGADGILDSADDLSAGGSLRVPRGADLQDARRHEAQEEPKPGEPQEDLQPVRTDRDQPDPARTTRAERPPGALHGKEGEPGSRGSRGSRDGGDSGDGLDGRNDQTGREASEAQSGVSIIQ